VDSYGVYLKQQRQKQNISLDEAIEATKISRNVLIAIEEDQSEKLPPLPFLKGFIRSYSIFLGLDPVETTSQYLQSLPKIQNNTYNEEASVNFYINKPLVLLLKRNRHYAFIFAFIVFILTMLIVSFLWTQAHEHYKRNTSKNTLYNNTLINRNRRAFSLDSTIKYTPEKRLDEKINLMTEEPLTEDIEKETELIVEDSKNDNENVQEEKKALVIKAIKKTWLDIKIDTEKNFDLIMHPGKVMEFEATNGFELLVGNAAGVEISFQGCSLGTLGDPNEVVRLRLPLL